jgi:hypothetical protein
VLVFNGRFSLSDRHLNVAVLIFSLLLQLLMLLLSRISDDGFILICHIEVAVCLLGRLLLLLLERTVNLLL